MYVVVLVRYRALLPFMYLLLLVEYVGRLTLGLWKGPLETASTPPGSPFSVIMIVVSIAMLALSLRDRNRDAVLVPSGAARADEAPAR